MDMSSLCCAQCLMRPGLGQRSCALRQGPGRREGFRRQSESGAVHVIPAAAPGRAMDCGTAGGTMPNGSGSPASPLRRRTSIWSFGWSGPVGVDAVQLEEGDRRTNFTDGLAGDPRDS